MTGAPYTAAEIERAIGLRDAGLPWRIVAIRMGRPVQGLTVTVSMFRRGLWAPKQKHSRSKALAAQIETLVASGAGPAAIAPHVGMSRPAVSMRLARMGLDAEMRRELAATRPLAKPLLGARL